MKKIALSFIAITLCFLSLKAQTPLEGKTWYLLSIQGEEIPPCYQGRLKLNSGYMEGFAFCNEFLGKYGLQANNRIVCSGFQNTRKYCSLFEETMRFEAAFLTAMKTIDRYYISDDRLFFFQNNELLLEFTSIPDPNPNPVQSYSYSYDNSGNRTRREVIFLCGEGYVYTKSGNKKKSDLDTSYYEHPITKEGDNFELKIYPNPTEGILKVEILGEKEVSKVNTEIFSTSGKLIYKSEGAKNAYQLDLSQYPAGVYVLRMLLDDKSYEWNVIKK